MCMDNTLRTTGLEELQNISETPTLQRVYVHSEASAVNYGRVITRDMLNLTAPGSPEPTVIVSS